MRSADQYRVRRIGRDGRSVARLLEHDEPRTSPLISGLLEYPEWKYRRALTVVGGSGDLAAVLVTVRQCFDYWTAYVYLADESAAGIVARLLDRSPAIGALGSSADIKPLVPLVRRARDVVSTRWAVVNHPVAGILDPPTERTRVATMTDLDGLVQLYLSYEDVQLPTRWQLKSYVRQMIERHVVIVCDVDGSIAGAAVFEGRTNSFVMISDMTVRPEHRQTGIAWELTRRAQTLAAAMRVGVSLVIAASNPMTSDDDRVMWSPDHYYAMSLWRLRRFKGQTRLRRAYRRIQPITPLQPHDSVVVNRTSGRRS